MKKQSLFSKAAAYVLILCMLLTGFWGAEPTPASGAESTAVYFLNSEGWSQVYGYVYAGGTTVGTGWPGDAAAEAPEIGSGWWKMTVSRNGVTEPFNIIFNNNSGSQIDAYITAASSNYMTADGVVYTTQAEAEASVNEDEEGETIVYFLNSKGWNSIGSYVYGAGEALGPWPGVTPEEAPEAGEDWYQVTVPAVPKFNIIFFNTEKDSERAELQIPSESYVYVTGSNMVYSSVLEAELSEGRGDLNQATTVYFYNNRGWEDVNGYTYVEEDGSSATLGAGWPGSPAEEAPEAGENWWKISVPKLASANNAFKIIFNDGMNQTEDVLITDTESVYVTVTAGLYSSAAEAEEAMADDDYDDGGETEPNPDLVNYDVVFDDAPAGAVLPYITYEAEKAVTNAQTLEDARIYRESVQSEASGREAVKLSQDGEYVEFTLREAANAMVIRYCMPDSEDGTGIDATLSMYVNGTEKQDLALTSRYAWVYGSYPYSNQTSEGNAHRFFDESRILLGETLPAGTVIRLQKDSTDEAEYYIVDFIECEETEAPLTQPQGSLSVLDYGAAANDGQSDYDAFTACISEASASGKTVWIPEGTFDFPDKQEIRVEDVTIQGAGMWHTNLVGAGVSFHYQGTCKFYDFAMTGVSAVRDDSGDLAGFEGVGKTVNVTIQDIWMEHMKVGVWNINGTGLVIQGCRIRNTYADGINLCSGTRNAVVRNNSIRNTGDDGIAIWPWQADCTDNFIEFNTVQVPALANNIAVYGGSDNTVAFNHVSDTINNGAGICIGSEFETKNGYSGTITVKNNLLERCGSYHTDYHYPIGAVWIWASNGPVNAEYQIYNNKLNDNSYEGILIDCWNTISGLKLHDMDMNGGTDGIYIRGTAAGSGEAANITMGNMTGELVNNEAASFVLTIQEGSDLNPGGGGATGDVNYGMYILLLAGGLCLAAASRKKLAK